MPPNHIDYARASGQVPPEWGKCVKCKRRTEVDVVSIDGRIISLCRKCQDEYKQPADMTKEIP